MSLVYEILKCNISKLRTTLLWWVISFTLALFYSKYVMGVFICIYIYKYLYIYKRGLPVNHLWSEVLFCAKPEGSTCLLSRYGLLDLHGCTSLVMCTCNITCHRFKKSRAIYTSFGSVPLSILRSSVKHSVQITILEHLLTKSQHILYIYFSQNKRITTSELNEKT